VWVCVRVFERARVEARKPMARVTCDQVSRCVHRDGWVMVMAKTPRDVYLDTDVALIHARCRSSTRAMCMHARARRAVSDAWWSLEEGEGGGD
jgi:hypothetical protein